MWQHFTMFHSQTEHTTAHINISHNMSNSVVYFFMYLIKICCICKPNDVFNSCFCVAKSCVYVYESIYYSFSVVYYFVISSLNWSNVLHCDVSSNWILTLNITLPLLRLICAYSTYCMQRWQRLHPTWEGIYVHVEIVNIHRHMLTINNTLTTACTHTLAEMS